MTDIQFGAVMMYAMIIFLALMLMYVVEQRDKLRSKLVKYKTFVARVACAAVSSGVCCCGDDMAGHTMPYSDGHQPRDEWDYALEIWLKELER